MLLALGACASMPQAPAGALSGMSQVHNTERASLMILPVPLSQAPFYRPAQACSYVQTTTAPNAKVPVERFTLEIKQARQNLVASLTSRLGTSTAVLGRDGQLIGYNVLGPDGVRRTPRNDRELSIAEAEKLRDSHGSTAHVVNSLTAIFPHYLKTSFAVEERVANVTAEDGSVWASYVYRGTTQWRGSNAAVLDLVRPFATARDAGPVHVGYLLVDLETKVPVLVVLDSGWSTRLERVSCPR
jgi:hypothetical protein